MAQPWRPLVRIAIVGSALLYGACDIYSHRPVARAPGVIAAADPEQLALADGPRRVARIDGADVIAVARFRMTARVLGVERYRFDRMAKWIPYDVAFGWGPMSDSSVLARIDISQGGRFYFWSTRDFPIPREAIEQHSANMHLLAADRLVARDIAASRAGQVVTLSGYLVDIRGDDGWSIATSQRRDDTGAGSCEVIWVESFEAN